MSKGGKQQQLEVKPTFNMAPVGEVLDNSFAELPSVVQRRVKALKNIHKEHLDLEKKYREEVTALDRKYQQLYTPLYLKRATVVKGEHEPTDAEAHVEGQDDVKADEKDKNIKGIPNFWLTVMQNNRSVGETITEADEDALAFLQDVRYTRLDGDKHGFQITFHFAENPYFTDSVLTKTYHLVDEDNIFGELVFDHSEGSPIKWKPGKNLTVKLVKKTQKARPQRGGKKGGAGRVITTEEPCESFFQFFSPPNRDNEDQEDDEENMMDDMLEADFEMGVIFKDKLIPHAALWFTGEALEFEDDFGDDFDFDDDEFGDDDDEDDEDDDEDEEEEEEEKPRKGRGGNQHQQQQQQQGGKKGGQPKLPPPSANPGAPGAPQQPECKQQ